MSKMIAVFGAPGSGKTTVAVKLAELLYSRSRGKSSVMVVFTDVITPTIPVIFPNHRREDIFSIGTILSKPDFFADDVISNVVMTKGRMNLGFLGYKDGKIFILTLPIPKTRQNISMIFCWAFAIISL